MLVTRGSNEDLMAQPPSSEAATGQPAPWPIPLRALLRAPVLFELLFGVSPLAGALYWGWDIYLLLMLHLLALAVSGAWLALRAATLSDVALRYFDPARKKQPGSPRTVRMLLTVMAVLGIGMPLLLFIGIVSETYGGPWHAAVNNPADFWRVVVVSSGLWLPLAAVCAWEAISFTADVVLPRLPLARPFQTPARPIGREWSHLSRELQAFLYVRAFVVLRMLVTVIAVGVGLVLAGFLGLIALIVLLVTCKTAVGMLLEAGAIVDAEKAKQDAGA